MNPEQAVRRTTLISGYHVSAAKNHVSSEKPRKLHCICLHSSSMLHNTLEWKSNANFKCSTKWQFQGYYFHTNNVENITLAEQKIKNVSEELSVTELTVKSYWIMLGRTWKSNVNFKFSLKLQSQGYYFHTSDVVNITVTEQNKNVTEEFRIMLGRT